MHLKLAWLSQTAALGTIDLYYIEDIHYHMLKYYPYEVLTRPGHGSKKARHAS